MKSLTRIPIVVGALLFLIALISSFASSLNRFGAAWELIAVLVIAFLALFVVYGVSLRLNRKTFLAVFLSLGFVIRMVWIVWNPTPPESDFLIMYNSALQAVSGDFSFGDSAYYTSFPYQLGFTMYEASMIGLFGNDLFYLKLMNIFFSVGSAVVLYYAASRAFNENCGRIATLFYLFYLPNIVMCSVLTNQHISTFLFLLGCFFLLRGVHSTGNWLLAGLSLGLGNLMRPIGVVYLAAVFLSFMPLIWRLWRKSDKRRALSATAKLAGVFAVFYLVQLLAGASLISSGVTSNALSGGDRYWKFMVGLNAETNGSWSSEDARYANQFAFGEERHRAELIKIKERLQNKSELAALMGRKLVLMWGGNDSSLFWSMHGLNRSDWEYRLSLGEGPWYVLMCAFGLIGMIMLLFGQSERHSRHLLYLILLLLYAAVHLIIEIQTRYRLDLNPVFILLQSYGFYRVYIWLRDRRLFLPYSPKGTKGLDA